MVTPAEIIRALVEAKDAGTHLKHSGALHRCVYCGGIGDLCHPNHGDDCPITLGREWLAEYDASCKEIEEIFANKEGAEDYPCVGSAL